MASHGGTSPSPSLRAISIQDSGRHAIATLFCFTPISAEAPVFARTPFVESQSPGCYRPASETVFLNSDPFLRLGHRNILQGKGLVRPAAFTLEHISLHNEADCITSLEYSPAGQNLMLTCCSSGDIIQQVRQLPSDRRSNFPKLAHQRTP